MTAIAVAHHIPYVAQAAGSHWHDLCRRRPSAPPPADGPAFLNVLTDCPLGWGHEPRSRPAILDLAVESRFWPLYEVVDGRYRLTYDVPEPVPLEEWLRPQVRFRHLLKPENEALLEDIKQHVERDWADLIRRCESDSLAA